MRSSRSSSGGAERPEKKKSTRATISYTLFTLKTRARSRCFGVFCQLCSYSTHCVQQRGRPPNSFILITVKSWEFYIVLIKHRKMDSFFGLFLEAEKPTQQIIWQKRRPRGGYIVIRHMVAKLQVWSPKHSWGNIFIWMDFGDQKLSLVTVCLVEKHPQIPSPLHGQRKSFLPGDKKYDCVV